MATPTGLPVFRLSSRPISSARASMASASLSISRLRSCGVVCCQVSNAVGGGIGRAVDVLAPLAGTLAMTCSFAGFSTSSVFPLRGLDPLRRR